MVIDLLEVKIGPILTRQLIQERIAEPHRVVMPVMMMRSMV